MGRNSERFPLRTNGRRNQMLRSVPTAQREVNAGDRAAPVGIRYPTDRRRYAAHTLKRRNEVGKVLAGLASAFVAAWITHVITCLNDDGAWGFLIAGALFFPIAIVHGIGIWFGVWH